MKKLSWPYTGNWESEMGSMKNRGDYRDFMEEGSGRPDSLTPEKFILEEQNPTAKISGGRTFVLDEDPMESNMFFDFLLGGEDLPENSNVLVVSDDLSTLESCASQKYNLFLLSKNSKLFSDKIICEAGDPKYYQFNKKFDAFYLAENNIDNLKLCCLNLSNQLKNISIGYFKTKLPVDSIKLASEYGGISISSILKIADDLYKVSFNNLKNCGIIGVLDSRGNTKATFICDIADSLEKKIAGLQLYSNINNSFGLLFPYKKATDVSYHMGTVSYPIDIIFIDDESSIRKIDENIQPGSPGLFSCSNIKNVLEIKGGMSKILDLRVGDTIFIDSAENLDSDSLVKNTAIKVSSSLPQSSYHYGNVSIKIHSDKPLQKTASEIIENNFAKDVAIIDLDSLLNYSIKLHKITSYDPYNVKNIIASSPKTIDNNYINTSILKYAANSIENWYCLPETTAAFSEGFTLKYKSNFEEILKFKGKIALATTKELDWNRVAGILNYQSRILCNKNFPEFETLIYNNSDSILSVAQDRYHNHDLYFLNKKAGIPIPKETTERAKEAEALFKKCKKLSEELLKNLKNNLSVYQTVQADKERVKGSKYEYNQSVDRNTKVLKNLLVDIKKALQIMNEIKDISNTFEIISAVASSTMRTSNVIKEIFDLVNFIENDDFITQLTQKTGEAEKMFLDLSNSNQRMINYINTEILGVLVITP